MKKKVKYTGIDVGSSAYTRVMKQVRKALSENRRVVMNMGTREMKTNARNPLGHYINVSIEI
jgi:precorrin-6B methylase 2